MGKKILGCVLFAVVLMGLFVPAFAEETGGALPETAESQSELSVASIEGEQAIIQTVSAASPVETQIVFPVTDGWCQVGDEWFYLAGGEPVTGWQTIEGKKYYFKTDSENEWSNMESEGAMVQGFLWAGGSNWYCFTPGTDAPGADSATGVMVEGWHHSGSEWFYFEPGTGLKTTGWKTIGGKQYYFKTGGSREWCDVQSEGAMVQGFLWAGGSNWYCFTPGTDAPGADSATGVMVYGWHLSGSNWYYFDPVTGKKATGLQSIGGKWYMLDSDGALQTGSVTLGVKTYTTDSDGALVGFSGSEATVKALNEAGWNLQAAYTWASQLRYANRSYRAGSVQEYADYGFSNGYGNCYVMNSCLYKLAETLGYEVKFVSGGVGGSNGYASPHGWCEIYDGDGWYVFDSNFKNETGRNGYRISYGEPGTWRYVFYNYMT